MTFPLTGRLGSCYPEWDVHRRRYRPDWCTVVESTPTPGDAATMHDTLAMRRSLARLGIGLAPCRRRAQGDEIDIDAAVEARVDTLAGSPQGDDYYIESLRRRRDLAVLVLLDVSGSTGEPGVGGKTVHDHQQSAAAALTAALHVLGDRVALYAFNSRGRQAVQLLRVKDFDDPLDAQAARRLGGLSPAAYTRLGAAIRHGTSVLEDHGGTPRLLLVVLSDGFAYDHGYEGRYGEADARRALAEARRRGVGCLCLSVGAATGAPALRRVFGTSAHAAVPSAERAARADRSALSGRAAVGRLRRRAFQRRERTRERLEIERKVNGGSARPFYLPVGDEEQVFKAAFRQGLSLMLKGPTGCGKTRLVEAMAHDLDRPLITVSCHDDLTTADLVGRFLLEGGETRWVDGPLTRAVREGAICYLDEVVEARQDTTVVIHPLADHRRQLPIDRLGIVLDAAPGFCLVVSYNPGYQSVLKDLKDSTRQRMVAIELDFPPADVEEKVVSHEAGVDHEHAAQLVQLAQAIRRLETAGLREVASTRVLIAAARLNAAGLAARRRGPRRHRRSTHRRSCRLGRPRRDGHELPRMPEGRTIDPARPPLTQPGSTRRRRAVRATNAAAVVVVIAGVAARRPGGRQRAHWRRAPSGSPIPGSPARRGPSSRCSGSTHWLALHQIGTVVMMVVLSSPSWWPGGATPAIRSC